MAALEDHVMVIVFRRILRSAKRSLVRSEKMPTSKWWIFPRDAIIFADTDYPGVITSFQTKTVPLQQQK